MTRTFDPPIPNALDCERLGIPVHELVLRMERELGFEPVRDFLATYGGVEVVIPSTDRTETASGRTLRAGEHAQVFAWLSASLGFGRIVFPMATTARRVRYAHAIASRLIAGASVSRTAFTLGVSTRRVSRERLRLTRRGLLQPKDLSC